MQFAPTQWSNVAEPEALLCLSKISTMKQSRLRNWQTGLAVCLKINFQTHSVSHVWGLFIPWQKTPTFLQYSQRDMWMCLIWVHKVKSPHPVTSVNDLFIPGLALIWYYKLHCDICMHPEEYYGYVHYTALFPLPLYLSSTSSYAWANSFSWEWFVGSRPGMNPAMVALQAGLRVERGRPADYRSDPVRCCASSPQLWLLLLVGVQFNTTVCETGGFDALAHSKSPVAHFQAGLDNP